jgi:predicted amidophosphoribosyltransferase
LFYTAATIAPPIKKTSEMFKRFKVGEKALAYPLALAIYTALGKRDLLDFDAVVPIPLSPDKEQAKEMHRTRLLATELASLLDARVGEYLSLLGPISKRRLIASGFRVQDFEQEYGDLLQVDPAIQRADRILLVDDVCTNGSTLRSAARKIQTVNSDCEIVAATAGQMVVKAVVADESVLLA